MKTNKREEKYAKDNNVVEFQKDAHYYFDKGTLYFQKNKLEKALVYFRKAVEMEPKNSLNYYNLGCLLSRMSKLKEANKIFRYIVDELDPDFTECYFLMAINYGLMENFEKTERFLRLYLNSSPEGEMADEARDLLFSITEWEEEEEVEAVYANEADLYQDIIEKATKEEIKTLYDKDSGLRNALTLGLFQWDDELKERIINLYSDAGLKEGTMRLKDFVKNPWVKERLRQVALLALKKMGTEGTLQVYQEGKIREVCRDDFPREASLWKSEWQKVLECVLDRMRSSKEYDEGFFEDIKAMWLDYINTVFPLVPRIGKIETWAAGLEYSLARFHFLTLTQREMAEKYQVSTSSVAAKYKEINRALGLERKAYQNVVSYLSSLEEGEGRH